MDRREPGLWSKYCILGKRKLQDQKLKGQLPEVCAYSCHWVCLSVAAVLVSDYPAGGQG